MSDFGYRLSKDFYNSRATTAETDPKNSFIDVRALRPLGLYRPFEERIKSFLNTMKSNDINDRGGSE